MLPMRIVTSALLIAALVLSLAVPAFAADTDTLTRGEFITALFEASGAKETQTHQEFFGDVPADGTLAQAVRWAAETKIINGYGNGKFGSDDPMTREQMAAMLYRGAQALGQTPEGEWTFPLGYQDAADISAYADKAVQWMSMNRLFADSVKTIEPAAAVTQGEFSRTLTVWQQFVSQDRDILILYTSDVHCSIDRGFGYAGLWEAKNALIAQGYNVILVDDGDSIQGESIGTMTKGAALTQLMDQLGYSVAIPGNHEFDYGMDEFLSLAEKTGYSYISCNFVHNGEPVFEPYVIRELGGKKIAFVGVTTPKTITSSTPAYFQNDVGEYVYGFCQDMTGEGVYNAVQNAADAARAAGADYIVVMAHLGNEVASTPWTYEDVITHTTGIDVLLDGHSHDTDQVVVKNAAGKSVPRSACGTRMGCIGWCRIATDGRISTGLYSWDREASAQELLGLDNSMTRTIADATDELNEKLKEIVAHTDVPLTINDPEAVDSNGKPVRIVRRMETNLGDLCADAFRNQSGADIAFANGGGVRANIAAGDITLGDLLSVQPFGNSLCMIEATGQQILDALEWGARSTPNESAAFLQVSGMRYEVHTYIDSPCVADENGLFLRVEGERRVKNVLVGGEPIDPDKTYTVASHDYMLLDYGDGFTMFDGAPLLLDCVKLDNQLLIDYIVETLGGVIGEQYADPYGDGRIKVVESAGKT